MPIYDLRHLRPYEGDLMESFESIMGEATRQVEEELALEDKGWLRFGDASGDVLTAADRVWNVKVSRVYAALDPLCAQALRLWTDYSVGNGVGFQVKEPDALKALQAHWRAMENNSCLSVMGQRRSSQKLLTDGEIFFAMFVGGPRTGLTRIRRIDPLEITEVIADPEDVDRVMYYRREFTNTQGEGKIMFYRSLQNIKGEDCKDSHKMTRSGGDTNMEDAVVYHFPFNPTRDRGNPLMLSAFDWLKLHRKFMASRVAMTLAMSRFAWKIKQLGGSEAVATTKAGLHEEVIKAGSTQIENMGATLTPIKAETGAAAAYQDGRMLKLLIASACGFPEQYFGDISSGNYATAKTVELPVLKMLASYQTLWGEVYDTMDGLVLRERGIMGDIHIDRDFPAIAPSDQTEIMSAIKTSIEAFPQFAYNRDVQMAALMAIGVDDVGRVLDDMAKQKPQQNSEAVLHHAIRDYTQQVKLALAAKEAERAWAGLTEGERDAIVVAVVRLLEQKGACNHD